MDTVTLISANSTLLTWAHPWRTSCTIWAISVLVSTPTFHPLLVIDYFSFHFFLLLCVCPWLFDHFLMICGNARTMCRETHAHQINKLAFNLYLRMIKISNGWSVVAVFIRTSVHVFLWSSSVIQRRFYAVSVMARIIEPNRWEM